MKKISLLSTIVLMCAGSVQAVVLAEPSYDTYTYLAYQSDKQYMPTINVSESRRPVDYHFAHSVIQFDVDGLSLNGNKYLSLIPLQYMILGEEVDGGPPEQTASLEGSATVHVVALDAQYSPTKNFYDNYIQNENANVVGTIEFQNLGTFYLDVTTIVNSWINGDKENFGFALWSSKGVVHISSSESGFGPQLTSVPEPSTYALFAGIAVLLGAMIYRKRK